MEENQNTSKSDSADNPNQVDFSQLVLGFSTAALCYLGEGSLSGAGGSEHAKNLPLAKYNIDIIKLLKEKTAGNLNSDEEKLINQLLDDLMLKFVGASK